MIDRGNQRQEERDAARWCPPRRGPQGVGSAKEPLLTYSLVLRPTDVGYLNKLGPGNLSLGLRRLIDEARTHSAPPPITHPTPIRAFWKVTAAPAIHVQPWLDSLAYRLDSAEQRGVHRRHAALPERH